MTPSVDIDRAVPDRVRTEDLPPPVAAEVDFLAGRTERWLDPVPAVHPAVRARALLVAGRASEAIAVLEALTDSERRDWSPQGLAAAVWSASRVPVPGLNDSLETGLDGFGEDLEDSGDFLTEAATPLCTASSLRGLLAVARGDLEEAVSSLEDAVSAGDRRAPLWGALARMELARVQLTIAHSVIDPDARARESTSSGLAGAVHAAACRNLGVARTFFASAGYEHLGSVTSGLLQLTASPQPQPLGGRYPPPAFAHDGKNPEPAGPTLGILSPRTPSPDATWSVGFGVQPFVRSQPRKGLVALRHLVANRHRQVPAVEIGAILQGTTREADPAWQPSTRRPLELFAEVDRIASSESANPSESSEPSPPWESAPTLHDLVFDERERSRISKLVWRTISSLADEHQGLAGHLSAYVHTGYLCSYSAPPHVRWVL